MRKSVEPTTVEAPSNAAKDVEATTSPATQTMDDEDDDVQILEGMPRPDSSAVIMPSDAAPLASPTKGLVLTHKFY